MRAFKSFALAGGLVIVAATGALAADFPAAPPPMPYAPPPEPDFGGWYLRGDVGVSYNDSDRWTQSPSNNGSTILSSGFVTNSLGGSAFVGAGVGYQFNSWLRSDVTAEFRTSINATGTYQEQTQFADINGLNNFIGQNNYKGNITSYVGLVNGYVDLGTWHGITPFVGAGVGFATHYASGFTDSGYASINGSVTPVAANLIQSATKTNLAWALHAGLAYSVTPNLKLELAYRYLNMGDAKSGNIVCGALSACNTVVQGFKIKEMEAHDIKLGLRWQFADFAPAPAPYPAPPLVRKY